VKTGLEELKNQFVRLWICGVVNSGFHNGARCNESDPHEGWSCGWYYRATLTEKHFEELVGEQS